MLGNCYSTMQQARVRSGRRIRGGVRCSPACAAASRQPGELGCTCPSDAGRRPRAGGERDSGTECPASAGREGRTCLARERREVWISSAPEMSHENVGYGWKIMPRHSGGRYTELGSTTKAQNQDSLRLLWHLDRSCSLILLTLGQEGISEVA